MDLESTNKEQQLTSWSAVILGLGVLLMAIPSSFLALGTFESFLLSLKVI